MWGLKVWLGRARRQVVADLRDDPYLQYILGVALVLAGFWFWHGVPNFTTWDEHSRVLDPLVAYGAVIADPSLEAVQHGVAWGREPFGGTFYLYAIAVLPVVLVALLTGNADAIAGIRFPVYDYAHYPVWHETPRWVWTWSLVFVRLTTVLFAVGTVYVTYRLGTTIQDRSTGRLAAILLTVTFGFLKLAKEGGEDMPATFFLLVSLLLLVEYIQTGSHRKFLAASATGGVALAFKLVAAPIVVCVGLAHLLKTRTDRGSWLSAFFQPRLLLSGATVGAVAILLGFPSLLVGDVGAVVDRIVGSAGGRASNQVGPTAPTWWWFTRTYSSALGLPLFLAGIGGVVGSVVSISTEAVKFETVREFSPRFDSTLLVTVCLGLFLLLFSTWHDFRVHHLLPTFPLIMLLLAGLLVPWYDRRPSVARPAIALLVLTSGVYAGVGTAKYASMPREEATEWLNQNAPPNATMETYYHGFLENAVPHGMRLNPLWASKTDGEAIDPCPTYIQVGYKDLLYLQDIPEDQLGYDVDDRVDARARYIRALLDGEYNYRIVAESGQRPPNFVPERPTPGSLRDLLPLGIYPHSDQYGDEQELAANQYVAILARDGPCDRTRAPPW